MDELRTITEKGSVRIPEAIRSLLGLCKGDRVSFKVEGSDSIVLKKEAKQSSTAGLLDPYLTPSTPGVGIEEMRFPFAEQYDES